VTPAYVLRHHCLLRIASTATGRLLEFWSRIVDDGARRRERSNLCRQSSEFVLDSLARRHAGASNLRRRDLLAEVCRLVEEKVVKLAVVECANDNTIGRVLKKTLSHRFVFRLPRLVPSGVQSWPRALPKSISAALHSAGVESA